MRSINILRVFFIVFLMTVGSGSMLLGFYIFEKMGPELFGLVLMFMFCICIPFIMFGAAKCFVHMVLNNEI